jgi:hypothetical protein
MSRRHVLLIILLIWGLGAGSRGATGPGGGPVITQAAHGEFGGDVDFLRKHSSGPRPGESNYYIDLWAEQNLRKLVRETGLTNNRALFVNSHGLGVLTGRGLQYAYQPHQSLLGPADKMPHFSAADLARVLGPVCAERIHNIVISGCNADDSFNPRELRKYFVNATNIIHMSGGKYGYQSMYFQLLTKDSSQNKPLYEIAARNRAGQLEFFLERTPTSHATVLSPYTAELFRPAALDPYKIQIAGREILLPGKSPLLISKGMPEAARGSFRTPAALAFNSLRNP